MWGKKAKHLGLSFLVSICLQHVIHMGSFREQEPAGLQALAVGCHARVGTRTYSIFKLGTSQQAYHRLVLERDKANWMIFLSRQIIIIRLLIIRPMPLNWGEKWWVQPCMLCLSVRSECEGTLPPLLIKKLSCFNDHRTPTDSRVESIF